MIQVDWSGAVDWFSMGWYDLLEWGTCQPFSSQELNLWGGKGPEALRSRRPATGFDLYIRAGDHLLLTLLLSSPCGKN